ncbi:hypothetical protein V8C40DRAFT_259210 [Trichoderma camerunense]
MASLQTSMLLRIAPLVSSSFCIWFAWDQYYFLHLFTTPTVRPKAGLVLPSYMKTFYPGASARVFFTYITTLSTSFATIYSQRQILEANESLWWYKVGLGLAAGHALFAPIIIPTIMKILKMEDNTAAQKDIMPLLARWLQIHTVRSLTVDLWAWVCFVVAVSRQ